MSEQAFPTPGCWYLDGSQQPKRIADPVPGMTRRDYFAAKAMQGMLANPTWNGLALQVAGVSDSQAFAVCARVSKAYADALIKELG